MIYYWLAQSVLPIDSSLVRNYHHYQCGQSSGQDLVASPCHQESLQMKTASVHTPESRVHRSVGSVRTFGCNTASLLKSTFGVFLYGISRAGDRFVCWISGIQFRGIHMICYCLDEANLHELFYRFHNRINRARMPRFVRHVQLGIEQLIYRSVDRKYPSFDWKRVFWYEPLQYYTRNIGGMV